MRVRAIFISALLALPLALAACGSDDDPQAAEGPRIVATTGILADIAQQVAGPGIEVEQVIPDGSSPHDFQLSARDRQVLEQADLLLTNGEGLEVGLPLGDVDGARWALADHAGELLPFEDSDEHGHGDDEDGGEGAADPHVWMDPTRVAAALPALAEALAEADPAGAAGYRERARRYRQRLRALDAEVERTLAVVPAANRGLITSHDSLGYLADRYGFEVVATAFPASGPEAEASAARIDELRRTVHETGVRAVFAQQEDGPAALRRIAAEAGIEIEAGLVVESPGSTGGYEEMLRHNAELIAGALAG